MSHTASFIFDLLHVHILVHFEPSSHFHRLLQNECHDSKLIVDDVTTSNNSCFSGTTASFHKDSTGNIPNPARTHHCSQDVKPRVLCRIKSAWRFPWNKRRLVYAMSKVVAAQSMSLASSAALIKNVKWFGWLRMASPGALAQQGSFSERR